jgi:leader peptidase (prepilin peptidase)/N-methyltransferase
VSVAFSPGLAFVLGACAGSFLNVCIGRWPHDQSVVRPASRCPRCERPIAWYDNIPIVSWLVLRAKCRGCGLPISIQYPAIELLTALLWLGAAVAFGPTFTALRVAVFTTVMLGIAVTDLRHYLIPDGFTVFGLLFFLATALVAGLRGDADIFAGPWEAVLGACVGAGAVSIVGWLGEVALKKEAMGFGDVTLMAVVGAAVGPGRALLVLFLGAALGALTFAVIVLPLTRLRARPASTPAASASAPAMAAPERSGDESPSSSAADETEPGLPHVPFGVFLAPAAVVALVWGDLLVSWYLDRVF